MRFRRPILQFLSLVLICTTGLSLGVDIHVWLVSHDEESAGHDTHSCPLCQQALKSPKLVLPSLCLEFITEVPVGHVAVVPESRPLAVRDGDPISLRGPPSLKLSLIH